MFSNLRGSPLVLCQFLLEIHAFIPKQAGVSGEEPPEKQKKGGLMAISQKRVEKKNQVLQWHPAFFAGLQIELEEDADCLEFIQEYSLGTKPMEIDVLIKKEEKRVLKKSIGKIFRKHNIIEYKSPMDYLSVDDYYKAYGLGISQTS